MPRPDGPVTRSATGAAARDEPAPPRVCVVITCYNQASYLGEAIESALAQTHPPARVIVVDDGSTDDTARVAGRYPGVLYIHRANGGLAAARNTGMLASDAEYLVFLDADDRLLPDALRAGLECLRAHPDAAFAFGHYRFIRADGSFLRENPPEFPDDDAYRGFLRGNYVGMHATVMYRREILCAVDGFDPALRACEDYDVYLRISRRYPVRRHTTTIAEYRQHGSNMSSNVGLMLDSALAVLSRQAEYTRGDPLREEALREGIEGWKRHYARQFVGQLAGGRIPRDAKEAARGMAVLARGVAGVGAALRRRLRAVPDVGRVDFGQLRRVTPISMVFGYDRGLPVDRYYIEGFLARNAGAVRGRVLEVGDDAYTRRFGGERVTTSDVLHVAEGNSRATFVGDLTSADHVPSDAFDCVILTQTLHLIYDVPAAIATLHRILRPGGVLLTTFPGISQIDQGEWGGTWFWGFTLQSARRLFAESFPEQALTFETHGNVLAAVSFLHGLAVEELRPAELDYHDPHYQLVIAVRAVKPGAAS